MAKSQKTQGDARPSLARSALTTGDVAAHCQVSAETVANWIRRGVLSAYRTPGRHRRIRVDELQRFLVAHGMPVLEEVGGQASRPRLLVVDDDAAVLRLVRTVLEQDDEYQLATAADGFEAGIQLGRLRPDLVVLDLMMPNLDGFAVCRRIKETPETRHAAVLVLTGYGDRRNEARALACGADGYMTKPFEALQLRERVRALLDRGRLGQASATTPRGGHFGAAIEGH